MKYCYKLSHLSIKTPKIHKQQCLIQQNLKIQHPITAYVTVKLCT